MFYDWAIPVVTALVLTNPNVVPMTKFSRVAWYESNKGIRIEESLGIKLPNDHHEFFLDSIGYKEYDSGVEYHFLYRSQEDYANNSTAHVEIKNEVERDIFQRAISNSEKVPGIVNMANPQYQFNRDEDFYDLWITADSGTIMNTKDTSTIYTLSSESVKEVYEFFINENR